MSSPLLPNVTDSVHVFGLPAARLPPVYTDYQLHEQLINRVRASAASTDGNESAFEVPQFKGTIVHNMTVMEVLLVSLCLLLWAVSVAVFLRKWGRIRILQPQEPRYRYSPKNLETIKVIDNASQSVIYQPGHNKQRTPSADNGTGIAALVRQSVHRMPVPRGSTGSPEQVRRMSTMPNIKVPSTAAGSARGTKDPLQIIRTSSSRDDVNSASATVTGGACRPFTNDKTDKRVTARQQGDVIGTVATTLFSKTPSYAEEERLPLISAQSQQPDSGSKKSPVLGTAPVSHYVECYSLQQHHHMNMQLATTNSR